MKLRILSDLHLEFFAFDYHYGNEDVVILAGDIHVGDRAIAWIKETIKEIPVIYVLGNHEYYGYAYPKLLDNIKDLVKDSNIYLLENDAVIIDQIKFCGCTLWSDFCILGNPKLAGLHANQKMNDYHQIRKSPSYSKLRAIDTILIHNKSLLWLKQEVKQQQFDKLVIITHHCPSQKSIPEKFQGDVLTGAFASNLDEFVITSRADLWIHGHVHDSFNYFIGEAKVICNPRGYIPNEPNPDFIPDLILEI